MGEEERQSGGQRFPAGRPASRRRPAAERLVRVASEMFYREGVRTVGVDTVCERAGVSKRTLYNRFEGKDALVAEYLRRRDERWRAGLEEAAARCSGPKEKLLGVFDAYGAWISCGEFRGCAFANAAAEIPDPDHPAREVVRRHKEGVRAHLAGLAADAGFREAGAMSERLLLLLEGATVLAAVRRDLEPLRDARALAAELVGCREAVPPPEEG